MYLQIFNAVGVAYMCKDSGKKFHPEHDWVKNIRC